MRFDQLAGLIERHRPAMRGMLDEARVFRLEAQKIKDARDTRCFSEALALWEPDARVIENFRLPFDCVSVECADSRDSSAPACAVLQHEGQKADMRFKYLVGWGNDTFAHGVFRAFPDWMEAEPEKYGRMCKLESMTCFTWARRGLWRGEWDADLREVDIRRERLDFLENSDSAWDKMIAADAKGEKPGVALLAKAELEEREPKLKQLISNICFLTCVESVACVMAINEPSAFVVEERPLNLKDEIRNPNKILRSAHRPHFIVLTPKDIRRRFITEQVESEPTGEAIKRMPHERRGHFRKLTSERFRFARGNVIWVDACWIGPREAVKGKNKYIVRLDV